VTHKQVTLTKLTVVPEFLALSFMPMVSQKDLVPSFIFQLYYHHQYQEADTTFVSLLYLPKSNGHNLCPRSIYASCCSLVAGEKLEKQQHN